MKDIEISLRDAGFTEAERKEYLEKDSDKARKNLLMAKRAALMEAYHRDAGRIDCLDFIARSLEKKEKK